MMNENARGLLPEDFNPESSDPWLGENYVGEIPNAEEVTEE